MTTLAPTLWRIAALALAYVITGKLGLLLAIPPGYATAIFPPAGIALAAVLLWGYPLLPGVWLGSFCMNLLISYASFGSLGGQALLVASAVGTGACLQAGLSALLIRRFMNEPVALGGLREILLFFALGGVLGCLINASISVSVLHWIGAVSAQEFAYSWFTWWIGDAIGVLIAAPLAFILYGRPRSVWRPRLLTVAAPLAVALALVIFAFYRASDWENERIAREFEQELGHAAARFEEHSRESLQVVDAIERLYASTGEMNRPRFHTFVAHILARNPDLRSLSWNPRVPAAERAAFEAARRQEDYPDFLITELGPAGDLARVAPRPEYFPVTYAEPHAGNERAVGYDVASEPVRAAVLQHARDTGEPAASPPLRLVQDSGRKPGVLVYAPVYRNGMIPGSIAARREALIAYATAVLNPTAILASVFTDLDENLVRVRLNDTTEPAMPRDLLDQRGESSPQRTELHVERRFRLADREWTLSLDALPSYLVSHRTWQAWAVLAGGLIFSGLLGAFMLLVTGQTARVKQQVEERTADLHRALHSLSESEQRFRIFADAAPVMMWMTDAQLRLELANDRWLAFMGHTLEEERARPWNGDEIHPEDRPRCLACYSAHLHAGTAFSQIYRMRDQHGVYHWIEEIAVPRFALNGPYQGHIGACLDITERRLAERRVELALQEKTVLLNEVHHRVKNNLQTISSLLRLQTAQSADPSARAALADSQMRIKSMALMHQLLYERGDFSQVQLADYLTRLAQLVRSSHLGAGTHIALTTDMEPVHLDLQRAVPCGLMVNELLNNAFKHAFPGGREGQVRLELQQVQDEVRLTVTDDGIGLPAGFEPARATTLGLQLVPLLVDQIGGRYAFVPHAGTRFELCFPLSKPAERLPT